MANIGDGRWPSFSLICRDTHSLPKLTVMNMKLHSHRPLPPERVLSSSRLFLTSRAGLIGLAGAFSLFCSAAQAESTGKEAFAEFVAASERLGIKIEYGSLDYDPANDVLTVADYGYDLSGRIAVASKETGAASVKAGETAQEVATPSALEYAYSGAAGTMKITGLTMDGNKITARTWQYSEDFEIRLEAAFGDFQVAMVRQYDAFKSTNYGLTLPGEPDKAPNRPVSRLLSALKILVLSERFDEVLLGDGTRSINIKTTVDGEERLLLSSTVHEGDARLTDVKNGRIGSYFIGQSEETSRQFDFASGQMLETRIRQKHPSLTGLDLGAFLSLFDPDVPSDGEAVTLIESVTAQDVEQSEEIAPGDILKVRAKDVSLQGVTLVKRDQNILALLDRYLSGETLEPEEVMDATLQLMRAFGIKDLRLQNLEIRRREPGSSTDRDISIAELAISGFSSNGLEQFLISGFEAPDLPDATSVFLERGEITGLEFADHTNVRAALLKLIGNPDYGQTHPLEILRGMAPKAVSYRVDNLKVGLEGKGIVHFEKLELDANSVVPPIPTSLRVQNTFSVPISMVDDRHAQKLYRSLGIERLRWDDETRVSWDEETHELHLQKLKLGFDDMGTAELSARFTNIPRALFEDPKGQWQSVAIMAQLTEASLTFVDKGLSSKGLQELAKEKGVSLEDARKHFVKQLAGETAVLQNADFTRMVEQAASDFISGEGKLRITLAPTAPIPVAQILGSLAAPGSLPDLLAVDIRGE